jgi:hypothetical protein
MANMCKEILLLETVICDSSLPLMLLKQESLSADQAMEGLACRPSPKFVVTALRHVGFNYVYSTKTAPDHPDFHFKWKNNMDSMRNGHNLRCIFIASRKRLDNDKLIQLS